MRSLFLATGAVLLIVARVPAQTPAYQVSAIRYGTLAAFPVAGLVAGADTARRMDIAMLVWLIQGPGGRNVLMDAGFYRDKFIRQWKPSELVRPSDAVARAGVKPEQITDIIVSHIHWDHVDGADLFPGAQVWIQRAEYDYYVDNMGRPKNRSIDSVDAAMLAGFKVDGRLKLVPGDSREIIPGITVYTGGRHTHESQFATVKTAAGTVLLASDNLYLYENLDRHVPIAATLDSASNLRAQERMLRLASDRRLIIPGHDPAIFQRFSKPGNGVARIE